MAGSLRELFGEIVLKAGEGLADLKKYNEGLDDASDGLDETEKKSKKLGASLKGLGRIARGTGKAVAKGVAVGTGIVVAGTIAVTAYAAAWAKSTDELGKTADKINVTAQELQELRVAAQFNGAEIEEVTGVLKDLQINTLDAQAGTGPLSDAVKILGLNIDELAKMDVIDRMGFLADEINKVEDDSSRTALTVLAFGEDGLKMGTLLEQGSKGINKSRAALGKWGTVVSDKALKNASKLNDSLLKQQIFFKSIAGFVGGKLAPIVTKYSDKLGDLILRNKDLIATRAEQIFLILADAMEKGVPAITELIVKGGELVEMVGGIDSAIRLAAEAWAVFRLAALAAFGPVGAITAAVGVAVIGLNRIERERDKKQDADDARDKRLRNPNDVLAGLTEAELSRAPDSLILAQLNQIEDAQILSKLRTSSQIRQSEAFRRNALRSSGLGGKSGFRAGGSSDPAVAAASKRLTEDKRNIKIAQKAADESAKFAAKEREKFDEALAKRSTDEIVEATAASKRSQKEILDRIKRFGKGEFDDDGGGGGKGEEGKAPTLAEQLAAVVGGKAEDISTVLSAKGVGASINNIDARVFVNVGGVQQTFPIPNTASPREIAATAAGETANVIVDAVTTAFDQQRSLLIG